MSPNLANRRSGPPRLGRARRRRLLSLALVVGLGASTPTSSQALLTELVVGGAVLAQVAGILGEALPQISALATSFKTVVQDGEIGQTVGRIVDILLPGKRPEKKPGGDPRPPADEPGGTPDVPPERPPPEPGRRLELPRLDPRPGPGVDLRPAPLPGDEDAVAELETLARIVISWERQQGLQVALGKADEEQRPPLEAGLLALAREYEGAVEELVEQLRRAARDGRQEAIEAVVQASRELEGPRREALRPVLEALAGRGASFGALYGDGEQQAVPRGSFDALGELLEELEEQGEPGESGP